MPGSWVQQTAYGIVLYVVQMVAGEWSNQIWQWFSVLFSPPVPVLADPLVQRLVTVSTSLVLAFLPIAVGWTALRETLARLDGSSTSPPEALIRRAVVTGVAVTGTSLLAWALVTFTEQTRGVLSAVGLNINLFRQFFQVPSQPVSTVLFLTVAFLVGGLLLVVQRAVIAAEFTLLLAMGPVMAAGLIRESGSSTWTVWVREMISLLITPLVQMLVMLVFLTKWGNIGGVLQVGDRVAALAFLYVLWKTPGWARHMVYTGTGAGAAVGGAVAVGRLVVMRQMMRMAFRV